MEIYSNMEGGYQEANETILKSYYEGFVDVNNPKYQTIKNIAEEDEMNLWGSIYHYNRKYYPTRSRNYCFISRVFRAKLNEIKDNRILDTPIANNQPKTHTKQPPN